MYGRELHWASRAWWLQPTDGCLVGWRKRWVWGEAAKNRSVGAAVILAESYSQSVRFISYCWTESYSRCVVPKPTPDGCLESYSFFCRELLPVLVFKFGLELEPSSLGLNLCLWHFKSEPKLVLLTLGQLWSLQRFYQKLKKWDRWFGSSTLKSNFEPFK